MLSPDDETYAKFGFYAGHGVQEILVAHPLERWVECWAWVLPRGAWERVSDSAVFQVSMRTLEADIDWP